MSGPTGASPSAAERAHAAGPCTTCVLVGAALLAAVVETTLARVVLMQVTAASRR